MLFPDKDILRLKELIETRENIVLITHLNPDGDAVGSSAALYHYLRSKGSKVTVIYPNEFPDFLEFLTIGVEYTIGYKDLDRAKSLLNESDLIFCLDFNRSLRVGKYLEDTLRETKVDKVLIDHHLEPEDSFQLLFSHVPASSTCEIVYEILYHLEEYKPFLTKDIAMAIYTGICTDTGSFSFGCNHKRIYEIVGELVENGANVEYVHQEVFNTYSESRLRLLGFCLCERLVVIHEKKTAYIYLSKADLERFNFQIGDTEGIVNYCLAMKGIEFGALISERLDRVRLSLRSKYDFNVNEFAAKYWSGGGHKNASGGYSFDSLENVIKEFERQVNELDL